MLQKWRVKIRAWYTGKYVSHEYDPNSALVFIGGGNYRRHWTALLTRELVSFWLKYWQWIIGVVVAITAVVINATK
jgi:hypothetical protein